MTRRRSRSPAGEPVDIFAVLRERDVLVHHPYDSFATSVEAFVAQAADDPDVLGIKQTLYRTSGDSPIVASLIRAAEPGKQVADGRRAQGPLRRAGQHRLGEGARRGGRPRGLRPGRPEDPLEDRLVVRREDDGIRRYCHIGTGNYNSKTARIYEDLGLLTADEDIGADLGDLFNHLTGFSRHADYRQSWSRRSRPGTGSSSSIDEQAAAGPAGRIVFKLNGLTDPAVIDALYGASMAGVPIDLVVRGLCSLRPGVRASPRPSGSARSSASSSSTPGSSASAHPGSRRTGGREPRTTGSRGRLDVGPASRGGARSRSTPLRVYIGSSDLMRRNLDRRIEVLAPVHDRRLVARLLEVLDLALADDTNSWELDATGRVATGSRRSGGSASGAPEGAGRRSRARRRRDIETRAQPSPSG